MTARRLLLAAYLLVRPGALAGQDLADSDVCAAARALLAREADSMLAIRPGDWQPPPGDDSLAARVATADVVIQIRVDTLGRPDLRSFRSLRSRDPAFVQIARREINQLELSPYDVLPGCRAAFLLTLPMRFSQVRRY